MKKKLFNKRGCRGKKLAIGFMAIFLCGMQSAQSVMATMHYDRRQTVASEQFESSVETFSAASAARATVNKNAWKKINGVCYNGSGKPIPGAITRGIDVSEWQGTINWEKVKSSDVDYAFVRISYGLNYMDKKYDYNMEQAELAGVPVGTYVYSTAKNTAGALKEAQLAINKMKGYKVSYPVAYDLEDSKIQKLSKKTVSEMALAFCNEVRRAGYYPIIYCNTYWYDNFIDWSMLSGLDVWIARYGDTIQAPDKAKYSYTIWQSTDGNTESGLNPMKGLIAGIPSWNDSDIDFGYVDYTKKITPRWEPVASYVPADRANTGSYENQAKNGWVEEDGSTFYYVNGQKAAGWKEIDNKKYYFDPDTGSLYKDKLFKDDGQVYYVDSDGVMYANKWLTDYKGKTYYFKSDGAAYKGMKRVDGKYYWFHTTQGYIYKNRKVVRSTGDIYYFGSDGVRCEDGMKRVTENGTSRTYYFHTDGKAHKGWLTYKGKKYYFYKGNSKILSGTRAENIALTSSNNIVSVFDKNGVCTKQYKK